MAAGDRGDSPEDSRIAEIRHRMANCFQMLIGLIRFRLRHVQNDEARVTLVWLGNVVLALGGLQRELAASERLGFRSYLEKAISLWETVIRDKDIAIRIEAGEEVEIVDDVATPLVLILHELVTNSLEHAFKDGRGGGVTIAFSVDWRGSAELLVTDDGCGIDPSIQLGQRPVQERSFGLSLVTRLTGQLRGTFDIVPGEERGTVARIAFPLRQSNPA